MKKVFKEYWLLMLIGALLLCGAVYFVIEDNTGKIAGKKENGNDVVFSTGTENVTADEFYESLYESYGPAGIYQFMLKAVADALKNKYKIAESRINIEFKGDTEQPKEGTANRVTIAVAKSEKVVETVK